MSSHRSSPSRRRVTGRVRALLSLGAVAFLAIGFGAQGTFAFWTDSATVTTGQFSSGTLDIKLDGALAGNGGITTPPAFTLTNMVPGESLAFAFPVANAGSVGLTYTAAGTASGDLAPAMRFTVATGSMSNTGSAAAGTRAGTCTGGTTLASDRTFDAAPVTVTPTARALVAPGAGTSSESICVVVSLPGSTLNEFQGKSLTAGLVFSAKQVGAP